MAPERSFHWLSIWLKEEVERTALTEYELQTLSAKTFSAERLSIVKDIFLFSCYSGLAYADVQKLKRSEIVIGMDGEKWIFTKRQKTDSSSRIPLLPAALQILNRYAEHPQCKFGDKVLPVLSNQKMNAYLKEIADVCGITKNLTYHIARHTFATTVTLSNGVPIETVSKMLGHRNLKTTQHYAKILDKKISEDMKSLYSKPGKLDNDQRITIYRKAFPLMIPVSKKTLNKYFLFLFFFAGLVQSGNCMKNRSTGREVGGESTAQNGNIVKIGNVGKTESGSQQKTTKGGGENSLCLLT